MKEGFPYRLVVRLLYLLGLILFITFIIAAIPIFIKTDFTNTAHLGDSIGGITAPFIGVLAVFTTFIAFVVQYEANQQQRADIRLERFENKFYEMLRLHRENTKEISTQHINGRDCFISMYNEFVYIYKVISLEYERLKNELSYHYSERKLTELAYIFYFHGIQEIENPRINYYTKDFDSDLVSIILEELKLQSRTFIDKKAKRDQVTLFIRRLEPQESYVFTTQPFGGYSPQLGHYYRHLYQTVKMVTTDEVLKRKNPMEEWQIRYKYVKLIRVQFSNHEQVMIYFNSFFKAGNIWWEEDEKSNLVNPWNKPLSYFLDYALIKNLPLNLTRDAAIGPNPIKEFEDKLLKRGLPIEKLKLVMQDLFEWLE